MALKICRFCAHSEVVQGPRNERRRGVCDKPKCVATAMLMLAEEDMLSREETDKLNELLTPEVTA